MQPILGHPRKRFARFGQRHEMAVAGLFGDVLALCVEAGLVQVGVLATYFDGTFLTKEGWLKPNGGTAERFLAAITYDNRDDPVKIVAKGRASSSGVIDKAYEHLLIKNAVSRSTRALTRAG